MNKKISMNSCNYLKLFQVSCLNLCITKLSIFTLLSKDSEKTQMIINDDRKAY